MRSRWIAAWLLAACVTACASGETITEVSGWFGRGGSLHCVGADGSTFGFELDESDLRLERDGDELILEGAVGPDGVEFEQGGGDATYVFRLPDGRSAHWQGHGVTIGTEHHRLATPPTRVPVGAR